MVDFTSLKEFELPKRDKGVDGYIYFLFYDHQLVYIGKSISIAGRIAQHMDVKLFNRVLLEPCDGEKLAEREIQLIKHYKPVLNGASNRNPDTRMVLVNDQLFVHWHLSNYRIKDGEVLSGLSRVGYCDGRRVAILTSWDMIYYNLENNKYKYTKLNNLEGKKRLNTNYQFDKNKFVYFYEERKEIPKSKLTFGKIHGFSKKHPYLEGIEIPTDYTFKFGKYAGKTAMHVSSINPQYIKWFQETVPSNQW